MNDKTLNRRIETFMNEQPWIQDLGIVIEVHDCGTSYRHKKYPYKGITFPFEFMSKLEGMIVGIQRWEGWKNESRRRKVS
jgi:hypothetical protein